MEHLVWLIVVGLVLHSSWKKSDNHLGNDVTLTLKKAHLGRLPAGEFAEQYVSKGLLTEEELRFPLSQETIQQMKNCSVIHRNEVHCRMVKSKFGFGKGQVLLALSIAFRGELPNGQPVNVDLKEKYITAYILGDKAKGWMLSRIGN